jgi:uncharacterized protein (UPF0128 family)
MTSKKIKSNCLLCGETFEAYISTEKKYCSAKCGNASKTKTYEVDGKKYSIRELAKQRNENVFALYQRIYRNGLDRALRE